MDTRAKASPASTMFRSMKYKVSFFKQSLKLKSDYGRYLCIEDGLCYGSVSCSRTCFFYVVVNVVFREMFVI